eukprot:TRINITY_DN13806_c0_g1_i1.p2 TRINITY_DN13806_c0_g1~~TRINITY_DN13806_c0_g1_i1.p2  ORF type:complete len:369 (-),score=73.29 TRINITY_DN13806_c0_g1_i1:55-1161(-)
MRTFGKPVQLPVLGDADYVHDIAYDYYGRRLAVCTSSLRISVFSGPEDGGEGPWVETARNDRPHSAPIWRLAWGHPEHGEPLVSCSEDKSINIYATSGFGGSASTGSAAERRPVKGNAGVEAAPPKLLVSHSLSMDAPVVDVRVAPAPLGLRLAACTPEGKVKIFESQSARGYDQWAHEELPRSDLRPAAAAAAAGAAQAAVPFAALDWMPVPFGSSESEGSQATLAVAGRAGKLCIWMRSAKGWVEAHSTTDATLASGTVRDVAWCPNLCRSYEIIATCGKGVTLWKVELCAEGGRVGRKNPEMKALAKLELDDPEAIVQRVNWNLTGTILAVCAEGAEVSLWRQDATLEWTKVQEEDEDAELTAQN